LTWAFATVRGISVQARLWRMLAPRWSHAPLSGAGAARAGGRWNERGQPALYLSLDHSTAIAEYQQDLPRPGTLTAYDVAATSILDLTDAKILRDLVIEAEVLKAAWKRVRDVEAGRPVSWDLAAAAKAAGHQGVLVPSVQAVGKNLVLWSWNDEGGAKVVLVDPIGDLPRDQSSWT
jgi:RES domain-containing protein